MAKQDPKRRINAMSDMPQSGWESDHFVTVDDHILIAGKEFSETLDHIGDAFIRELDDLESQEFKLLAEKMLHAAEYANIDDETLETARRSFFFGKLIGYLVLERSSESLAYMGNNAIDDAVSSESERIDNLLTGSLCEIRDSPRFRGFVDQHRSVLDPSGERDDVIRLFAGFSLLVMQNSLYFQSNLEQMSLDGDVMAKASDEDWQREIDNLLGE